jgi:thiol:disulfide interchange protein DsbD
MARTNQRHIPIALFAIAAALLVARVSVFAFKRDPAPKDSRVRWYKAEDAVNMAASSNRVILYDFTAAWCRPCDELDAAVFQNPELAAEINERFIPVRVVDRKQEDGRNLSIVEDLERQYRVRGFPTVIFADAAGNERARMEGFRGREGFERVMEQVP